MFTVNKQNCDLGLVIITPSLELFTVIQIGVKAPEQAITTGSWNKINSVKYFSRGKYQSTLTKKQALEKISDSTKNGFKVITGVLINGKNYLLVIDSK